MNLSILHKIRKQRSNYQNSINGVIDEGKVADNESQQVGGHFLSWLKNCPLHSMAIDGDTA